MAADMNETFMIRTSSPEISTDEHDLSIDKVQKSLTKVKLKTKLSDEQKQHICQTPKQQTPPMELVILPKTQDETSVYFILIISKIISLRFLFSFCILVSKCDRS